MNQQNIFHHLLSIFLLDLNYFNYPIIYNFFHLKSKGFAKEHLDFLFLLDYEFVELYCYLKNRTFIAGYILDEIIHFRNKHYSQNNLADM
jgi:hypothetical protein